MSEDLSMGTERRVGILGNVGDMFGNIGCDSSLPFFFLILAMIFGGSF